MGVKNWYTVLIDLIIFIFIWLILVDLAPGLQLRVSEIFILKKTELTFLFPLFLLGFAAVFLSLSASFC